MTVIGVIVIGSVSAAGALFSAANGSRSPSTNPTTAHAAATATATNTSTSTQATTSGTTDTSTPTATSPAPTRPPSGQVVDLHCTIANPQSDDNQFTCNNGGTTWTVQVNGSTTYEGFQPPTFNGLRQGMDAEIKGVVTGATTFLAYHVNAQAQGN